MLSLCIKVLTHSHGNGTIGSVLENVTEVSYRLETLTCDLEICLLNAADCVGNCPCGPVFSVFLRVGSL
jgi:NADH:ubiquinone oxidoreductase subunit E